MFVLRKISALLATAGSLILAGCGGGGDSSVCGYDEFGNPLFCQTTPPPPSSPPSPVAATAPFPVNQALVNISNQQYLFNVSATDSYGNVFTIAYSSVPGPASTFGTAQASTANISESLSENGNTIDSLNMTDYFSGSPYQFLGSYENTPGGSEVVNSWQIPPTTATVGQVFPSLTSTLYHDSTNSVIDGTLIETLGLSPDTATTALLCENDTIQLTQSGINDGLTSGSNSTCFRIDMNGNLLGMQINSQINGMQLQFY